jgi:hypothetical protein
MMGLCRVLCLLSLVVPLDLVPVYPGAIHTHLGDDLSLDGFSFRIAYFTTRDSIRIVAKYFFQEWKQQGYPTVVEGDFEGEAVVSAFSTRTALQRAVVLRRQRDKTLGFSVVRQLRSHFSAAPADRMPALEHALWTSDLAAGGASATDWQRTAILEGGLLNVRDLARQQLERTGCALVRQAKDGEGRRARISLEHLCAKGPVATVLSEEEPGITALLQTHASDAFSAEASQKSRAGQAGK